MYPRFLYFSFSSDDCVSRVSAVEKKSFCIRLHPLNTVGVVVVVDNQISCRTALFTPGHHISS